MMKSAVCLFVLFTFAYAEWTTSSFIDDVSDSVHICVNDDDIDGQYAFKGLLQGSIEDDNIIRGNFYEAGGNSNGNCLVGSFEWTETTNGFSGTYTCQDDDEGAQEWTGTITSEVPNDETCARLGDNASIAGRWNLPAGDDFGDVDAFICADDEEYENSFDYEEGGDEVRGYESGITYGRNIGSGVYGDNLSQSGPSLLFALNDGRLGNFYAVDDDDEYFYDIYDREGSSTGSQCNSNQNDSEDDDDGNDNVSSDASIISTSVAVVMVMLCFIGLN